MSTNFCIGFVILLSWFLLPGYSTADELPVPKRPSQNPFTDYPSLGDIYFPPPEKTYLEQSVDYLLSSHGQVSDAVRLFGEKMDRYFAGEDYDGEDNESYFKVGVANRWIEGGDYEPELDYKFRVDLPATKRRYRLVLSYRDDDDKSLEERSRPSSEVLPPDEQSFFAGLVKQMKSESGRWEGKITGGIKVKVPPDPFIRASTKRYFDTGEVWSTQVRSGVQWFNSDGFRWEADLIFERLVAFDLLFRPRTSLDWREENDTLEFGQTFTLYQELSQTQAIEYQLGAFGSSMSRARMNTYYISASYRHNLYKELLYMQVIPELAFERENNFTDTASITLAFQLFFR